MNRTLLRFAAVFGLLSVGIAAREIRTPLPWQYGFGHYPLDADYMRHEDQRDKGDHCYCWDFRLTGLLFERNADAAFVNNCCGTNYCTGTCNCCGDCQGDYVCTTCTPTTSSTANNCCDDKNTTNKVPWVTLLFGQPDFTLAQSFPGGVVAPGTLPENPFVSIAKLKPRFEYNEKSAFFIADLKSVFDWCDCDYRLGLKARLPVRDIAVTDVCAASDLVGEDLSDVWQVRNELDPSGTTSNVVYAGRLDFLSQLYNVYNPPAGNEALVNYSDTRETPNQITINRQKVGAPVVVANGDPCIEVIYRADSTVPTDEFWGRQTALTDTPVQGNGSGLANDGRGRFVAATDYVTGGLSTDVPAQSKLFVVPSLKVDGTDIILTQGATSIRQAVEVAIQNMDHNVEAFLEENGICVCDGRTKGLGDLDLELYLGRNWGCEKSWWTDLFVACRFPTGKELCNCKLLFKQPAGNDHHFEIRLGGEAGWDACDWIKFMIDAQYAWALKHCESLAAPFEGATIKNIGPCINGEVKWGYFVGHADVAFFANDCCGCDIGYELYAKGHDQICFNTSTATDLAGTAEQPLDPCVLTNHTNRMAHKICTSLFTRIHSCEVALGFNTVVAGKNAPRDTDMYVAMSINF